LIRNTAAQQLADVQKQHPDELFNLLTRVVPYLKSRSWDTRTAAAKALGGIVENAACYDPNEDEGDVIKDESDEESAQSESPSETRLTFSSLDVVTIIRDGNELLGSGNKELEYRLAAMEPLERLAYQQQTLRARLGFYGKYVEKLPDVPQDDGRDAGSMPSKIDTNVPAFASMPSASSNFSPSENAQSPNDGSLTSRQLNMLKRRKKRELKSQANKVRIVDLSDRTGTNNQPSTPGTAQPVALKTAGDADEKGIGDYFSLERKGTEDDSKLVKEYTGPPVPDKSTLQTAAEEDGSEWPFDRLCEMLAIDLFDGSWEVRHGAAMGLREVMRVHGHGAGRVRGKSRSVNDVLNQSWLENMACQLCCVFMLDRFGDYVSDNVVVPVRESSGQAFATVLKHMSSRGVKEAFGVLRDIVQHQPVEGRGRPCYGGIIGIRYMVSTRSDLLSTEPDLLDGVLECVLQTLEDIDDDVRAVSAAAIAPITKEIVASRPGVLDKLVSVTWNCLCELGDDLSASTGNVMDLLAKLCGFPAVLDAMKNNAEQDDELSFAHLVPRLFPFLRHTITSVRAAVLRALLTFLGIKTPGAADWVDDKALRLIFQNILLERNEEVLQLSSQVWSALLDALAERSSTALVTHLEKILDPLVTLTVHPIGVPRAHIPMDPSLLIRPSGHAFGPPLSTPTSRSHRRKSPAANGDGGAPGPVKRRRKDRDSVASASLSTHHAHNIDAPAMAGEVELLGADVMLCNKLAAARALGAAMAAWPAAEREATFAARIALQLKAPCASTQLAAALVSEEYARQRGGVDGGDDALGSALATALRNAVDAERPLWYAELKTALTVVRAQCQHLLNAFRETAHVLAAKVPTPAVVVQGDENASIYAFSVADAERIVGADYERLTKGLSAATRLTAGRALEEARAAACEALDEARLAKEARDVRVRAAAAAALVALGHVPKKPAVTIKAMMDSVKAEESARLQARSAAAVALLVRHMVDAGKRVVSDKVVGNLVKFYCTETAETPEFHVNALMVDGILSLRKEEDVRDFSDAQRLELEAKRARIMRRGAKEGLEQIVQMFGAELFVKLPCLRDLIEQPLLKAFGGEALPDDILDPENPFGQEVVDGLSTLRAFVPKFHPDLLPFVSVLLPVMAKALQSKLAVLRYAAAKCFSTVCSVMTVQGITMLVEKVLPSMNNPLDVHCRQGGIEAIYHLIHVMEERILPYVIFLIVPVLGRMSDSDNDVRLIAATAFATLVKLVPLEAGIPDPPGFSEELLEGRERERKFIGQMLDPKKAEDFQIPVAIKASLRPYQQDGVNWLAFLNKYNLHGVLCDDMGLGKTLQTLCIVASDHHMRADEFERTQNPDKRRLPSLIVCPPTLSGHWRQEIAQFAPFLKAVSYTGPSSERSKVRGDLAGADVVITSYEVCRNDIAVLGPLNWNYCVLDEGHLIKNPKAKTSIAVKSLKSYHRLILSGTPIQNNVLELWSLFDFLMPGFLGSEKVFQDRFAKPIAASRNAKSSSKEQEAGALAIEALHKQVLPFLLRRLKEEVLNDLPPKILQNYYCDLSDLQRRLFDDFGRKEKRRVQDAAADKSVEGKRHIFQALQYMRKLCNSPALVVKDTHRQFAQITQQLAKQGSTLQDIAHAPKLTALCDLLVDCGIGASDTPGNGGDASQFATAEAGAVSQHRALVFCQMKEMLDMVQRSVLDKLLPSVQYLRLDGSVEASRRQDIVNRFNSDPSYDVLLLTTSVGGLGLNLTGADTVIFVEHDWNPQKDLQAMDRAHRIGQKKVVNVYRIVTRGTLEEKILKYVTSPIARDTY
jgi:TATA-binding protein-associated factor